MFEKAHTHTNNLKGVRMVACVSARARGHSGMWVWRCLGAHVAARFLRFFFFFKKKKRKKF